MSQVGQTLINIVRQKAAAEPDFVYQYPEGSGTCMYVHKGKPSCLIGQALWTAGLIDSGLEESTYNTEISTALIRGLLDLEVDDDELVWLRNVQANQDSSLAWANAVIWADKNPGARPEDFAA